MSVREKYVALVARLTLINSRGAPATRAVGGGRSSADALPGALPLLEALNEARELGWRVRRRRKARSRARSRARSMPIALRSNRLVADPRSQAAQTSSSGIAKAARRRPTGSIYKRLLDRQLDASVSRGFAKRSAGALFSHLRQRVTCLLYTSPSPRDS